MQSVAAAGVAGKLYIESRGTFRVVEVHGTGSYSIQLFDKPVGAVRKFLARNLYALPPQILPCDDVDLSDLRYLNTDFAPVRHPLKKNHSM